MATTTLPKTGNEASGQSERPLLATNDNGDCHTPVILGVDPGLGGALAFLDADGSLQVFDMPVHRLKRGAKVKREIDRYELARIVDAHGPIAHAFVEQVGAMPGQGVTSMFQFGRSLGIVEGVIAAAFVPTDYVTPGKWRTAMGVRAGKDGSRARASALMPRHAGLWTRVRDDGRAEAALIALYGQQQLAKEAVR
jgi:crossover junction endodeoxyribonuclease RuvC